MNGSARPPAAVLLLTVLGFCALYAPQPLLPILADAFDASAADVSLLITATLLPLAVAPLAYGYLLEGRSARRMVVAAALGLALCHAAMAAVEDWAWLMAIRGVEGLILPALLTSLMTYVALSAPQHGMRRALAWYVAATIVGGFAGRAVSGWVATLAGWRLALGLWAPALALVALFFTRLPDSVNSRFGRVGARVFRDVLSQPGLAYGYLAILCVFFVFAGLLNVLPFRLRNLDPQLSTTGIGFAYAGYLSGFAFALGSQKVRDLFGNEARTLAVGMLLYAVGLSMFAIPSVAGVYSAMFVFCAGMFLVHGRLSGQVNHLAQRNHGVVNGLYIASYYLGGSLGSWLPTLLYRRGAWLAFLALLGVILLLGAWSLSRFVGVEEQE